MDVDRISAMGGVIEEHDPAWTRGKARRRKFSEDVEPEVEQEAAAGAAEEDEGHEGLLDVVA